MDRSLPAPARLLGPAGLIPFAALALAAWTAPPEWVEPARRALAAYGATILAFLGAVHWGLALRAPEAERAADWPRLGLGVVPQLIGWVALLLPSGLGLSVIAWAMLGTASVESGWARKGWVPVGFLRLRWMLSLGAAACLLAAAFAA